MDRCALFVDAGYLLADGAMAVHGTRNRDSVAWDYSGLVQFLNEVARDRTGLPLRRCYWYEAIAHAPFVYARPGTLKAKSDLPLLTWYETEPTARGLRLRYSVVFTNEDGGTPPDRLMATWGRTTDLEFVYSVDRYNRE